MSHEKKTARLPLIAFAALPLTVGLAFASTTISSGKMTTPAPTQRVQPAQPGQSGSATTTPRTHSGTNYSDVFLQKLAAGLGISVERLKAAAVTAGTATIDQGVKAGDFPSDRAADMKAHLAQDPFEFAGRHGGRGGHGHGGDRGGRFPGGRQGTVAPADQGSVTTDPNQS